MMSMYENAGRRIQATRIMRGYSREKLAKAAKISSKFLYEIETGKKGFSALVLCNLCEVLSIDCDYVLTGKQDITYDQELIMALELFEKSKTEQIANILTQIYKLLE